jgi:hypothetical protein
MGEGTGKEAWEYAVITAQRRKGTERHRGVMEIKTA